MLLIATENQILVVLQTLAVHMDSQQSSPNVVDADAAGERFLFCGQVDS